MIRVLKAYTSHPKAHPLCGPSIPSRLRLSFSIQSMSSAPIVRTKTSVVPQNLGRKPQNRGGQYTRPSNGHTEQSSLWVASGLESLSATSGHPRVHVEDGKWQVDRWDQELRLRATDWAWWACHGPKERDLWRRSKLRNGLFRKACGRGSQIYRTDCRLEYRLIVCVR